MTTARQVWAAAEAWAPEESEKHPRGAAGSPTGGQFVKKDQAPSRGRSASGGRARGRAASAKTGPRKPPAIERGTGMTGAPDPRVKVLQKILTQLGLKVAEDGRFGPKTEAAVREAQRRLGLPDDGRVTVAVIRKLAGTKELPGAKKVDGDKPKRKRKCTCRTAESFGWCAEPCDG